MSIICQKNKCKEMHIINTINLIQKINKLSLETSKLLEEKWALEKKYNELKKNYNKLRRAHEKNIKMVTQKSIQ